MKLSSELETILSIFDKYELSEDDLSYLLQNLECPPDPKTKPCIGDLTIYNNEPHRVISVCPVTERQGETRVLVGWTTGLARNKYETKITPFFPKREYI